MRTTHEREVDIMITRKELESLGVVMTDKQWKEFQEQIAKVEDKMYEESHPMDE